MFTTQEVEDAIKEMQNLSLGRGTPEWMGAITWLYLKDLYHAAINSDLVGWENIEMEEWLGIKNG